MSQKARAGRRIRDYGTARRFAGGNDYVGDSWVDIETGRAAGNFAVGVLWGFRDEEELRAHHADAVITAPGELLELL